MKTKIFYLLLVALFSYVIVGCRTNEPSNPQEQVDSTNSDDGSNNDNNIGGNNNNDNSGDIQEQITTFVITWHHYSNDSYSDEIRTDLYAIKQLDHIYLCKRANINSMIGTLLPNTDKKIDNYDVSSFTYRCMDVVDLHTTKYYYTILPSKFTDNNSSSSGSGSGSTGNSDSSGETDDLSTNYAPSDVTNYKFTFTKAFTHYVYFTSNSSVNSSLSYINKLTSHITITGGSYTKTSNNKATITLQYIESGQSKNQSFELTFTSTTQGKIKQSGDLIASNFTCEYLGYSSSASAPYSIEYKKFTTGKSSFADWWQFGSEDGGIVSITSSSNSYPVEYATYSRNSSTSATLIIYHRISSSAPLNSYQYSLTFNTSTSGSYSRSFSNSFYSSTTSGEFTLN